MVAYFIVNLQFVQTPFFKTDMCDAEAETLCVKVDPCRCFWLNLTLQAVDKLFAEQKFDGVIHFAGLKVACVPRMDLLSCTMSLVRNCYCFVLNRPQPWLTSQCFIRFCYDKKTHKVVPTIEAVHWQLQPSTVQKQLQWTMVPCD